MADIADMAGDRNEVEERLIMQHSRKPEGPKANGRCHNCNEPLPDFDKPAEQRTLRWCDVDCTREYEHKQSRRAVN